MDKLRTLADAATLFESGASIAIGGFTSQRHPMALIREIIRRGTRDLVAYAHYSGSDLALYNRAAGTEAGFADYLARYVTEPADHATYLAAIGGAAGLQALRADLDYGHNPRLEREGRWNPPTPPSK